MTWVLAHMGYTELKPGSDAVDGTAGRHHSTSGHGLDGGTMKTIIAAGSATLIAFGIAAPASATVVDAPYVSEGDYTVSTVSKGQKAKVVSSSCWGTGKGWKASLQVRKKGTSSWKTVQTVRPRRSDDCEDNSWTTVFSWTPRTVGTYELREKYSDGDRSRALKVKVTTEEAPDAPDASTPNDLGTFPGEDPSSGLTKYVSAEKSRVESYITSLVNKNRFCYSNALASGDVDGAATCQRVSGQLENLKTAVRTAVKSTNSEAKNLDLLRGYRVKAETIYYGG